MGNRRIAELVFEFVPLNRRRVQGDPPLSVLELERWSELRDHLAYEFGHSPPVGPARQPRHLRVPTHLKVRYECDGEQSAQIENLSEGGLFVRCSEPLAAGTPLRLEIEVASGAPLRLDATVVHSRELENLDGPAGFGVEFLDLEADDHVRLVELLEAALSEVSQGD
ncbi:MAG: PilZ domain-containing protein [Myxococcota bacterium]